MDKAPNKTIFELAAKITAFCDEVDKRYEAEIKVKKGDSSAPIK